MNSGALGLVALVLSCASCGPARSAPPVPLVDLAVARGAVGLSASSDGRFVAIERVVPGARVGQISVVDRGSWGTSATVRGALVSGPRPDGEVLYVDDQEPPHLRSTTRSAFVRELPSTTADVWSGHSLGDGAELVVVLRHSGFEVQAWVVRRHDGATTAHRVLSAEGARVLTSTAHPLDHRLYLSTRAQSGSGAFVALDGTLTERWRTPWPAGHLFDLHPVMAVSGDGARLVAVAPSGLLSVDARDGADGHLFPFHGLPPRSLAALPGRAELAVLRVHDRPPEPPNYQIELLDARDGARVTLRAGTGAYPQALVFAGPTLYVAP